MISRINIAIFTFLTASTVLAGGGQEQNVKPISTQSTKLVTELRATVSKLNLLLPH